MLHLLHSLIFLSKIPTIVFFLISCCLKTLCSSDHSFLCLLWFTAWVYWRSTLKGIIANFHFFSFRKTQKNWLFMTASYDFSLSWSFFTTLMESRRNTQVKSLLLSYRNVFLAVGLVVCWNILEKLFYFVHFKLRCRFEKQSADAV